MNKQKATIYVVDGDASARGTLVRMLRSTGYRVVEFASTDDYFKHPRLGGNACLVLDTKAVGISGGVLPQALAMDKYVLPVIFIADHGDIPTSVRAMKDGAVDFLLKPFDKRDLLAAILRALEQSRRKDDEAAELAEIRTKISRLTPREAEVMAHVIKGKLNKQIASDLGVIEQTVKMHRSSMMHKMEVQSVAELVQMTQRTESVAQLGDNLSRCILDAIPSPVFAVEEGIRILDFNLAASKMLDQDRISVISKRAGEVLHCVHSTEASAICGHLPQCGDCIVRNSVNAALRGKKTTRQMAKLEVMVGENPTEALFIVTASPLAYEGKNIALVVFENITGLIDEKQIVQPAPAGISEGNPSNEIG